MGRPATLTDDERMVPCAVSLDKARRDKFKALGGSAWLRAAIDAARDPKLPPPQKLVLKPHQRFAAAQLTPRCPACLMPHGQHQPRCPKRRKA